MFICHNQLLCGLKISINNQHMTTVNYKNGLSNSNNSAESQSIMSADLLMFKVFIFLNCMFVVPRFQIIIIAWGAAKISYSQWTALKVPLDLFSTFFFDESSWGNPRPLVPSDWLRCGQIWHNYSWRKSSWCRKGCMEINGHIIRS